MNYFYDINKQINCQNDAQDNLLVKRKEDKT